jgi:thioredoxin-related protein
MRPNEEARLPVSRRALVTALLIGAWATADAQTPALPPALALADQLADALKRGGPLLVMVSLEGCLFCKMARESYLWPLRREQGLEVLQLDMRSSRPVTDFQGKVQTQDELVRHWGVRVAPTVLFFGAGGREVAERLVGGYIPDFYGAYLDQRLQVARAALKR